MSYTADGPGIDDPADDNQLYRRDPVSGLFEAVPATPPPTSLPGLPVVDRSVDPTEAALNRANTRMAQGAPWDLAAGGFIADLARAALAGDERVIARTRTPGDDR